MRRALDRRQQMSSLSAFAPFLILSVSVTALFAGYVKHRSLRALNNPPGPKGLPFLGNVLEINSSEPWLTFTRWASSYGLCLFVQKTTIVMPIPFPGNLVYCTLFGRQILIIQTTDAAKALLEQRSGVYSDRPPVKVHEE